MSKIFFFRHAQASFLAENYDKLSEKGIEQSKILGDYLVNGNYKFDRVYSGPLVRQKHTCSLVSESYKKAKVHFPEANILDGLKEHTASDALKLITPKLLAEDKYVQNLMSKGNEDPKLFRKNSILLFQYFMNNWVEGKIEVPGILPWKQFRADANNALQEILSQTNQGEKIAVFTSGGTISSMIGDSLKVQDQKRVASLNYSIRNTSMTTFMVSNSDFNLMSMNEVEHLDKDMITFV